MERGGLSHGFKTKIGRAGIIACPAFERDGFPTRMTGGLNYAISPSNNNIISFTSTVLSMIRSPQNAWRIFAGQFYFNEQMGHGFLQAMSRFTRENLQTMIGYNFTQFRNLGGVDRVDYWGGATFATNELHKEYQGVTLGNVINIYLPGKIDMPFREWVLKNERMYLHEYGHTFQSQLYGASYLLLIGLPSLRSAYNNRKITGDPLGAYSHDRFVPEVWANIWADRYFSKYYDYDWQENWGGLCYPLDWNY